ncbi:MAG TPA: hypothetical protein VEH84_04520 [Alphaproteobacteria bacterium]|nr:hypothetical protein [Alphaproteobacteria bacterium]
MKSFIVRLFLSLWAMLILWSAAILSKRHILNDDIGTFVSISSMFILSIILIQQVTSVAVQFRCVFCTALFKPGFFKSICERRLLSGLIAVPVGAVLGVELYTFVALSELWTISMLLADALVFGALHTLFVRANPASLTNESAKVLARVTSVFSNYILLFVTYAAFRLNNINHELQPFSPEIFKICSETVNHSWIYLEWYARTKCGLDLMIQSMTNVGGTVGAIITFAYLLLQSLAPFVAVSILFRAACELSDVLLAQFDRRKGGAEIVEDEIVREAP